MAGFFNTLKDMLTYKPEQTKPFELLEGADEGVEREDTPEAANIKADGGDGTKAPAQAGKIKIPLSPADWNRQKNEKASNGQEDPTDNSLVSGNLDANLDANMEGIKKAFGIPYNTDIMTRQFKIARKVNAFIAYMDGMVDKTVISDFIIRPLMDPQSLKDFFESNPACDIADFISDNVVSAHEIGKLKDFNTVVFEILSGNTVLFMDGSGTCLVISSTGFEKRRLGKPVTENVVMGSQEGFTENLRTNLTLIRKIIKNQNLITEMIKVGRQNQGYVGMMYMNGIVNQELVKEVRRRLNGIDADFIMGDGMVGQMIEDSPFMIFPQVLVTERPDRTASFLMEGKVAVISEGTPFAEVVPVTFYHFLQTSEDTMLRWQYGTFLRIIRMMGLFVSALLPALYVGLILFHQEMVPTELLASIAKSKEEVPFPTIVEMLLLEISFELIREGGIRIPGVIGQTLGIIGALILGQAAVAAGLVSPVLIIIVALTGLGSFAIPNYSMALGIRIIRFFFIFFAAILGFYGISLGLFLVACLACGMKSFGVPYFSPVAPKTRASADLILRHPIWRQKERPDYVNVPNRKRQRNPTRSWMGKGKGGSGR